MNNEALPGGAFRQFIRERPMYRAMLIAAATGVFAIVLTVYVVSASRRDAQTATIRGEAWPICSTVKSLAESADWAALDPEFAAGKRALAGGDWNGAIATLTSAALRDDRNADIQNYLGYAYHRLLQLGPAIRHYQRALVLNPRHRGAHEHLGEAFLMQDYAAKAREQLDALGQICLIPCEEYDDLKQALAGHSTATRR